MLEPRLDHPKFKIRQLIEEYRAGSIVIPEFQREYVWRRKKAPHLIDSLYRAYPISSLLLWSSTEETRARRRDPRPSRSAMINWLIDGQQRVITLSRCMSGDEDIDVVFNPDAQSFQLANASTANDPNNWFHLSEIWDDVAYRNLRRNLHGAKAETREKRFEKVRAILDYEVPAVKMIDHSFDDAVSAFTRINTLGVKLKKEDIESAHIAAKHSGFIADDVSPFLQSIRQRGYERINVMHLFRACAFIAKPDGRDRTPLHELNRADVQAAWSKTKRATQDAINLVRSELGLVNMDVLWSGALLVPLIALCATLSVRERNAREMIGWLALAALLHRYSGSAETALDQDLRVCRNDDPIGGLLSNLRKDWDELRARPDDFGGALVDKSGLLAAYIACHRRGLMDLFSEGRVILQEQVERHHILPRSQFPEADRADADCIANIAFTSAGANRDVSNKGPEVYLKTISRKALETQCIPIDPQLWRIDRSEDFWSARRELLAAAFNDFLSWALPKRKIR